MSSIVCTSCHKSKDHTNMKNVKLESYGEKERRPICNECISLLKHDIIKLKDHDMGEISKIKVRTVSSGGYNYVVHSNDKPICQVDCPNGDSINISLLGLIQQLTTKVNKLQMTLDTLMERVDLYPGEVYEMHKKDFENSIGESM